LKLEVIAETMLAGEFDLAGDYQRLAFAFASKSAKSYQGVLRLAENGLGEPALILVRTLFEDLVNLVYISKEPERLAALFLDFHILEKKKYIEYWEEAGLGDVEVEQLRHEWETHYKAAYARVLPNYPKRTYWSGKNLKEMAAVDPELAKTYCTLYPYISGFAHGGSPLALASYVGQADDLTMRSLAAPSEAELSEALVAGYSLFTKCLWVFADSCRVDSTALKALNDQADRLFR